MAANQRPAGLLPNIQAGRYPANISNFLEVSAVILIIFQEFSSFDTIVGGLNSAD